MSQPLPPSYASAPSAYDRPLNVMSIIAFILSLVGLSLFAVILGHIGMSQIKRTGERGRGFAIAALVIGYVGIVLSIILVILILVTTGIAASQGIITTG
ncbi:DUF4190 domain-containing protein [Naasia sp. SYSU D00948]|uniref:DUF4190 domain-containing protein n=1 Tax=Naasia sp. SYSU D00948 TaxID=2817379 RepID=UPI001B314CBC|nr:DUF4190 domain-containing protein [Naasia sp. SYSU D00948]